jgi:anti-sigma factor RsiW
VMNCGRFEREIYEYLDGSLSPRAQAAAEEHLSTCAACRQMLSQEQQAAQSLSNHFRRATDSLQLPPGFGHQVLAELVLEDRPAREHQVIPLFWRRLAWPLAVAASALVLLGGFFFFVREPGPRLGRAQPHSSGNGVTVELSYVVPTYTFRMQGGFVTDALSYRTNFVNERLPASRASLE